MSTKAIIIVIIITPFKIVYTTYIHTHAQSEIFKNCRIKIFFFILFSSFSNERNKTTTTTTTAFTKIQNLNDYITDIYSFISLQSKIFQIVSFILSIFLSLLNSKESKTKETLDEGEKNHRHSSFEHPYYKVISFHFQIHSNSFSILIP